MSAGEGHGRTEGLLRERGKELGQSPLPAGSPERILAALSADRARRHMRGRLGWGAGLAAAAAVVLLLIRPGGAPDFGRVELAVALLDAGGRELESEARGAPEDFVPPTELLLEIVAAGDGHARVVAYDLAGAREPLERSVPLTAGEDRLWRRPLEGLAPLPRGDSEVSFLIFASREGIPGAELEELLPAHLDEPQGPGRADELRELAALLGRELGCDVFVRSALVARSAP